MNDAMGWNQALGWTLFHFLWEGAAVALLLAIVMAATTSARARYTAACLAMLAMLAAFAVTLEVKFPSAESGGGAVVHVPAGVLRLAPAPPENSGAPAMLPYAWAVPVWLAGVALLSLHRMMGFAAACRLRKVGVCTAPATWQTRAGEFAARLGITRPVLLLESCLAEVPAAAGYLRPAILLPVGLLAGLPAGQVEFILIHELAHIARRDYLVNLMQSVVEALLFYHPAVWWVSNVIRSEREHCCDDLVVALAGDRHGYAAALVALELGRVPQPAMAATGGSLTRRVRRLLRQPAPSESLGAPLAAFGLAVLVAGVTLAAGQTEHVKPPRVPLAHPAAPVLTAQALQPNPKPAETPAPPADTPALQGPYRKWLNEDAAYIISDAERQAFKQLSTSAEFEQFIEQFWLRRDPTPRTVENEFKEEHYRRIAYSNEHFASSIPGWKTDRGRVYITYGPPDEIEDHSSGGTYQRPAAEGGGTTTVLPFQQWRYKFLEGIGKDVIIEFVDAARNGEYRMTVDPHEKDALLFAPGAAASGVLASDRAKLADLRKTYTDSHPSVVALKKKIVAEQGPTNHFVANQPGGRTTISVTGRQTMISMPLLTQGTFQVSGRVLTQDLRPVRSFEDPIVVKGDGPGRAYVKSMELPPGSYSLSLTVKNVETGETSTESVTFYVAQ